MNPFTEEELKRQQIEFRIHCAIVEQFQHSFPEAALWHTPNRGAGGADGHFKKLMGARKGASDLGLSWNLGRRYVDGSITKNFKLECGWYEVKAPGEKPTPEQNKWLSKFYAMGWHTGWGTSVKHAFDTFEAWGIPRISWSVKEPDLRSDMQKKHDAFEFFS